MLIDTLSWSQLLQLQGLLNRFSYYSESIQLIMQPANKIDYQ